MCRQNEYDPRYLRGIECFNECEFFEAHEVWEDLWTESEGSVRRFLQGMIQVAVCLHHFGNGNIRGARKLYDGCRQYLEDFLPKHCGLDVEKLLRELETCCAEIRTGQQPIPPVTIEPELTPKIHLDPPPRAPNA